jgi:predicted DNA-binding protein (MmcQ/YjbR family)
MNAKEIDDYCMTFSGAAQKDLFGPGVLCWVINDRVFAMMAEGADSVSLRCPDERAAQALIDHGRAGKLPGLPHGAWINLPLEGDDFDLKSRLRDSFEMVRTL